MRISWSIFALLFPILLVVPEMAGAEEQAAAEQEATYDTPHQRAFACFENDEMTFASYNFV